MFHDSGMQCLYKLFGFWCVLGKLSGCLPDLANFRLGVYMPYFMGEK
jgi:hypothetical protein